MSILGSGGDFEDLPPTLHTLAEINASAEAVAVDVLANIREMDNPLQARSPGFLGLGYGNNFVQHRTRVRLCFGADPNAVSTMAEEATLWATAMKYGISNEETIDTFYVYDQDGELLYSSLLTSPQQGQATIHTLETNAFTWTLTGRGLGGLGLNKSGEALTRVFPYSTVGIPARGMKFMLLSAEPGLLLTARALAISDKIWADFNGYKAGFRGRAPIQQNASAQRREGF